MVKRRNTRYLKRTHKFGIEVPKTVAEAHDLDRKNGNTLWMDAIVKEMREVQKAFKIIPDDQTAPIGYQKIPCHMVFDIKMEDFKHKARLVAGGHKTEAPATITYASVVSRETVRIALMLAALNDLQVKAGDVLNAYITALCKEKVWTVLGPDRLCGRKRRHHRTCVVWTQECGCSFPSPPCLLHAADELHILQG